MGQGAGAIRDVKSSKQIIEEIMAEAEEVIARMAALAKKAAAAA
jgi:NAD(P)H-dependent flavin oxidoreductase YrpB (nitropropane dioxygenase family)